MFLILDKSLLFWRNQSFVYKITLLQKHLSVKLFIGWNFCLLARNLPLTPFEEFYEQSFFFLKISFFFFLSYFMKKMVLIRPSYSELGQGNKILIGIIEPIEFVQEVFIEVEIHFVNPFMISFFLLFLFYFVWCIVHGSHFIVSINRHCILFIILYARESIVRKKNFLIQRLLAKISSAKAFIGRNVCHQTGI